MGLGHTFLAHAADASFPSDHVTAMAAAGIALWAAAPASVRYAGIALTAAGLAAGWARVFLGIHYSGDVLGALAIAGLVASPFGTPLGQHCCTSLTMRLEKLYRCLFARPIARGWVRA